MHRAVDEAVAEVAPAVLALARAIHADPEVARTEVRSSRACASLLEEAGFAVVWGEGDLHTAFRATLDTGLPGPRIAILGEYDSLPRIGHGCGHNLIAGASVGAGLALAAAGVPNGAVEVLGCPAEEIGFGKPAMLRAGMFDGITGAVAFHGAPFCAPARGFNAMRARSYVFLGAAGHAGVAPWLGRNALDAAVAFYTATAQLRQHSMDAERVHGILTETGEAWNVVPDRAVARFGVRAQTSERADVLIERLDQIARGAAEMHGCTVRFEGTESMQPLTYNAELADLAAEHLAALGYAPEPPKTVGASTDVGDVSEVVPTTLFFAPTWPAGTDFHTPAATDASGSDHAYDVMLDAARVIGRVIGDVHAVAAAR